jgi:hypothetical protein
MVGITELCGSIWVNRDLEVGGAIMLLGVEERR